MKELLRPHYENISCAVSKKIEVIIKRIFFLKVLGKCILFGKFSLDNPFKMN